MRIDEKKPTDAPAAAGVQSLQGNNTAAAANTAAAQNTAAATPAAAAARPTTAATPTTAAKPTTAATATAPSPTAIAPSADDMPANLLCPISMCVLEAPVMVPCCGRSYSRESLLRALRQRPACPLCCASLADFDAHNAPPNRSLEDAVERALAAASDTTAAGAAAPPPTLTDLTAPADWAVSVTHLADDSGATHAARLSIQCGNQRLCRAEPQLLILVLDISGSMHSTPSSASDSPLSQAMFARNALVDMARMAGPASNVQLATVAYNQSFVLEPTESQMRRGGGTSFLAAFKGIRQVLSQASIAACQRASVVFLTDGMGERDAANLFTALEGHLSDVWSGKHLVIHTVGFSASHDFQFLDALRTKGTEEGMFQYANPEDDKDELYNKLTALAAPILRGGACELSVRFDGTDVALNARLVLGSGQAWLSSADAQAIASSRANDGDGGCVHIETGGQRFSAVATFRSSNEFGLWLRWYSHLTDTVLQHLLDLDCKRAELHDDDFTLAALLLQKRAQALESALAAPAPDESELPSDVSLEALKVRVAQALGSIEQLLVGRTLDRRVMTDLRYQAQLAVKKRQADTAPRVVAPSAPSPSSTEADGADAESALEAQALEGGPDVIAELTLDRSGKRHLPPADDALLPLFRSICQAATDDVPLSAALGVATRDGLGQTPLILAASIGRARLVGRLLAAAQDSPRVPLATLLAQRNNAGLTPLDCALLHGYDRTAALLIAAKAPLTIAADSLLLSLIQRERYRSAEVMVTSGLAGITHEMARRSGSRQAATWAMERIDLSPEAEVRLAIRLGLLKRLQKHDPAAVPLISFAQCSHLWEADCHAGHVRVVAWLLKHGRMDAGETWPAPVALVPPAKRGAHEAPSPPEEGWPLLLAAAAGNAALCRALLPHAGDTLNRQTRSGRTPLSLACYFSHTTVVHALLEAGADPNVCENAGNPPLVPVCWQGNAAVAKLLLHYGANPRLHAPERDSVLLICARTGHVEIMEAVLRAFAPDEVASQLAWRASIDGFDALSAAVEQDRAACLPLLLAAGADVERRTAPNNPLLAGASTVHLAANFGSTACMQALYKAGADVSATTQGPEARPPLHIAVMRGAVETTAFLLSLPEGRAQLEVKDGLGRRPHYYAAMQGNERVYDRFFNNPMVVPLVACLLAGRPATASVLHTFAEAPPLVTLKKSVQSMELGCGGLSPMSLDALLRGSQGEVARALAGAGCCWTAADGTGLSPAFYACVAGEEDVAQAFGGLARVGGTAEVHTQLERLAAFKASDPQASILLDVRGMRTGATSKPQKGGAGRGSFALDPNGAAAASDVGPAMAEGFGRQADPDASDEFAEAVAMGASSSLLELVRRALRGVVPDRHVELLSAAKLAVVARVALGEAPLDAHAAELLIMHLATADVRVLARINACLFDNDMQDENWLSAAVAFAQGLSRLPVYRGECYRRVAVVKGEWAVGTVLAWDSFTICSADWATVTDDRVPGTVFIVHSRNGGRLLGKHAAVPQNALVCFHPGVCFRVLAFYRYSATALAQANIRQSSFAAKDVHMAKAVQGKASLIVEVEEVERETAAAE